MLGIVGDVDECVAMLMLVFMMRVPRWNYESIFTAWIGVALVPWRVPWYQATTVCRRSSAERIQEPEPLVKLIVALLPLTHGQERDVYKEDIGFSGVWCCTTTSQNAKEICDGKVSPDPAAPLTRNAPVD